MKIWFIVSAAFLISGWSAAAQTVPVALSWSDTEGQTRSVGEYHGKIVVVNFWATWCVPCQHEMPMLADMQKHYAEKGVVFLGASVDDQKTQAKVEPFAKKDRIPFPLLVGATTDEMQQLGLGETIPATAFFDQDGKLVARVLGELSKSDLQHRLDWMLGKHHGGPPPVFVDGFKKKNSETPMPVFTH